MRQRLIHFIVLVSVALLLSACAHYRIPYSSDAHFDTRRDSGEIRTQILAEISGIAASRLNHGILWVHNDSGDENRVFALDLTGRLIAIYHLQGCNAWDWEDIAVGPGPQPGVSYLYVGDIGDNLMIRENIEICRVAEPKLSVYSAEQRETLTDVETLLLRYPDGAHDAETLMIDPLTRDLYIVTKRDDRARLYRAPFPQPVGEKLTMEHAADLAFRGATAGDISPNGQEILVKTLGAIFYWRRDVGQAVAQTLVAAPRRVPYTREPQGEAVGWASDGNGYYTVSEKVMGLSPYLYYYPRLEN